MDFLVSATHLEHGALYQNSSENARAAGSSMSTPTAEVLSAAQPGPGRVLDGRRVAVVLVACVLSAPAIVLSLWFGAIAGFGGLSAALDGRVPPWLAIFAIGLSLPWFVFWHMAWAWMHHRYVSRVWPVLGLLVGVPMAVIAHKLWFLYVASMLLAGWLCGYHLRARTPARDLASLGTS